LLEGGRKREEEATEIREYHMPKHIWVLIRGSAQERDEERQIPIVFPTAAAPTMPIYFFCGGDEGTPGNQGKGGGSLPVMNTKKRTQNRKRSAAFPTATFFARKKGGGRAMIS